jgi:hypothetical protein
VFALRLSAARNREARHNLEGTDMSHHSSEPKKELQQAMRSLMGEYPDGRLNAADAGAVAMQVGVEEGRVVMHFAKPVAWVGLSGDEAMQWAQTLIKHARRAGLTAPMILRIGE